MTSAKACRVPCKRPRSSSRPDPRTLAVARPSAMSAEISRFQLLLNATGARRPPDTVADPEEVPCDRSRKGAAAGSPPWAAPPAERGCSAATLQPSSTECETSAVSSASGANGSWERKADSQSPMSACQIVVALSREYFSMTPTRPFLYDPITTDQTLSAAALMPVASDSLSDRLRRLPDARPHQKGHRPRRVPPAARTSDHWRCSRLSPSRGAKAHPPVGSRIPRREMGLAPRLAAWLNRAHNPST